MLRMGDAIVVGNLPTSGLDAVAGYVDGHWPDYQSARLRFPNLKHLAIDSTPAGWGRSPQADVLDIEYAANGPQDFPLFQAAWKPLNTRLPVGYTQASRVHEIIQAAAGPRSGYLIWSAHYTDIPHICTSSRCWPQSPVAWQADGTQWTNHNNRWDESLLADNFFATTPPPPPPKGPPPVPRNALPPSALPVQQVNTSTGRPGQWDVIMVGKDGRPYHLWFDAGGWHGPEDLSQPG